MRELYQRLESTDYLSPPIRWVDSRANHQRGFRKIASSRVHVASRIDSPRFRNDIARGTCNCHANAPFSIVTHALVHEPIAFRLHSIGNSNQSNPWARGQGRAMSASVISKVSILPIAFSDRHALTIYWLSNRVSDHSLAN